MESTKRSQFQNSEERQMRESGEPEAPAARSQSGDVDVPPEEWIAFLDSLQSPLVGSGIAPNHEGIRRFRLSAQVLKASLRD